MKLKWTIIPVHAYRSVQTTANHCHGFPPLRYCDCDCAVIVILCLFYFFCKEKSRKSKVHTPLDSYLTLGWSDMISPQKEVMSPPCPCCFWCCSPFWAETVARMRIFICFAYFLCCYCSWQLLAFGNLPQTHSATQESGLNCEDYSLVEFLSTSRSDVQLQRFPLWGHPSIQTVRKKLLTHGCFTCSLYLVTGARFWRSPLTLTHLLYKQVSYEPSSEITEWVPLSCLDAAWGPSLPLAG